MGITSIDDSKNVTLKERRNKRENIVENTYMLGGGCLFVCLFFKRLACTVKDLFTQWNSSYN